MPHISLLLSHIVLSYGRSAAAASNSSHDQSHVLAQCVRNLFDEMERSTSEKPVTPMMLLTVWYSNMSSKLSSVFCFSIQCPRSFSSLCHLALSFCSYLYFLQQVRQAFPQFAERSARGGYSQQDADEFYGQLMYSLLSKLKDVSVPLHNGGAGGSSSAGASAGAGASGGASASGSHKVMRVSDLFEGEFAQTTTCAESDAVAPQLSTDTFRVLKCHIDKDKSLLHGARECRGQRS